jgi:gliding motility-associated-like protein
VLEAQNPNSSKYVWSTGATTNEISVTQGGDYWVMEIGNCDSIFTYYNVIIHSVDVTITPGHILGKIGEVIDLSSNVSHTSSGSIDYQWSASNSILLCNSCENSQVELQSNGSVNLMVQDSFGCISQASITIEIDRSPDFHIPSGFSPNGDGLNDVFYVVGDGYLIENFSVYDRWGGKQFEVIDGYSGNPEHGWDASNITERGMNSTVFMYVARISDPDGFTHHVSGTIHLIR